MVAYVVWCFWETGSHEMQDMETASLLPPTEPGDGSQVDESSPDSATSDPYSAVDVDNDASLTNLDTLGFQIDYIHSTTRATLSYTFSSHVLRPMPTKEIQVDDLSVALALAFSGSDDSLKVKDEPVEPVECPAPDAQAPEVKPVENSEGSAKPGRRKLTRRETLNNQVV